MPKKRRTQRRSPDARVQAAIDANAQAAAETKGQRATDAKTPQTEAKTQRDRLTAPVSAPESRFRLIIGHPYLVLAARLAIGGIFIVSAGAKLAYPDAFVKAVADYGILPAAMVPPLATVLTWLELLAGAFLFFGLLTRVAALGAAALLVVFLGLMVVALAQGKSIDCGCFTGLIKETVGTWTLFRDVIMLVALVPVFLAAEHWLSLEGRRRPRTPFVNRLPSATVFAGFVVGFGLGFSFIAGGTALETGKSASGWTMGSADARVQIVVYSDFQCPACAIVSPVLERILGEYPDSVALIYKHFPLTSHPLAGPAAEAVEAAGEQGKFWEMHDALFENQDKLSADLPRELAVRLGLDLAAYDASLASGRPKAAVGSDRAEGVRIGVSYTPYILVDGQVIPDNAESSIKAAIERGLRQ